MTSIINNFEITSGLTITDGNLQVKTNSTNTSLDVSGNITIGSDNTVAGNTKLILKNVADSTIELSSVRKKNAITNKAGILQFTTDKNAGCLYEFELGDGNTSVGFRKKNGEINLAGIVFGKKSSTTNSSTTNSVDEYVNSHISYNTDNNSQSLNFTGEKIIFYTSTGNYETLGQAMIIDISGRIGMFTSNPTVSLDVGGNDAIRIPSGTTNQRPLTDASGCIRYNTTTSSYEGFKDGSEWGTLGGVIDVDRDTYISAETTPGTDNDQLKFYTDDSEKMIIDKNGRVGIGTSSPSQALHVIGSIQATTFFGNVIADTMNGTITTAAQPNITSVGTLTSLTTTGNVGIGTTSPGDKLEVNSGNIILKGNAPKIKFYSNNGTYGNEILSYHSDSVNYGLQIYTPGTSFWYNANYSYCSIQNRPNQDKPHGQFYLHYGNNNDSDRNVGVFLSASPSENNYINNGGNVGIGTNSPTYMLEVISEAQVSDPNFTPTYWYGSLYCGHTNGGITLGRIGPTHTNCIQSRYDGAGSSLAINPFGGNVGIGTTSPSHKLDVNGTMRVTGTITGNLQGNASTASTSTKSNVDVISSSHLHTVFVVTTGEYGGTSGGQSIHCSNGWYGLQYNASSNKLYVGSTAHSSDRRIKKNIRPMPDALALDLLRKLDVKYYNYINEETMGSQNVIGFIAQEVLDILPSAASVEPGTIPYHRSDVNVSWGETTDGYIMTLLSLSLKHGKYGFIMDDKDDLLLETLDGRTFKTEKKYSKVHLAAKEIDDFHRIDKDKIFAMAFSATQEIDKIQQEEKTKLEAAETEINTLKNDNVVLLNKIATLESNFYNLQQQVQTLINNP